jgi:uncharacterized protein YdbL (DUF1318 family)
MRLLLASLLLPLCALACRGPTVAIQAPDEPIVLNINVTVQQEVRVKLEDDVKRLLDAEGGVSTRDLGDPVQAPGAQLFAIEPEVEAARNDGLVGERYDGLLGLTPGHEDPATQQLVSQVNDNRLAAYSAIAAERNAPLPDVQVLAAQARIDAAPQGTLVLLQNGQWRRK